MEIEQIRRFLVAADTLNYTAAAQQLYVGQATISRQIAALEDELGVVLFKRHSRSVELTDAGKALQEEGLKLMMCVEHLKRRVRNESKVALGTLRITVRQAHFPGLEALCTRAREVYPELEISLSVSRYLNVCQDLDAGSSDLGITYSFLNPNRPEYDVIELENEQFVVLCNRRHYLAKQQGVYLDELHREDIMFGLSGIEMVLSPTTYKGEPNTKIIEQTSETHIENALMQLQLSEKIMILPRSAALQYQTSLVCIPILDETLQHKIILITKKGASSLALRCFLDVVQEHLSREQK